MRSASKNMIEGIVFFVVGLGLRLFAEDVEIAFFTLSKVGVVLMFVGGATLAYGIFQQVRGSAKSS